MVENQCSLLAQDSHAELLHWYRQVGVDIALSDKPADQFALHSQQKKESVRLPVNNKKSISVTGQQTTTLQKGSQMPDVAIPDKGMINSAREQAKNAKSLEKLYGIMADFKGCNLRLNAKNLVFSDGNPAADVMLVGEAPGRDEDIQGIPFVGRSGQLLDRMLAAIGLNRQNVYISNVIPWRPPGNRTPTPQETEICRPFIERHIELANPKILVLLGSSASKVLLKTSTGILKMRGCWHKYKLSGDHEQKYEIDAMPTLHPAYLLRQPAQKKLVWQDLLKIREKRLSIKT